MNLICSFSEELCTSYVLGTVLDTGDNAVIKVDKDPCPLRAFRKNQTLQTKCEVSVISLFFNDISHTGLGTNPTHLMSTNMSVLNFLSNKVIF